MTYDYSEDTAKMPRQVDQLTNALINGKPQDAAKKALEMIEGLQRVISWCGGVRVVDRKIPLTPAMEDVITQIKEYLDDRQDMEDGGDGRPQANKAMSLLQQLEQEFPT